MDFVTLTSTERIASNGRVVAMFLSVAPAVLLSAGFCCTICDVYDAGRCGLACPVPC